MNKLKITTLLFLTLLIAVSSCKKDDVKPDQEKAKKEQAKKRINKYPTIEMIAPKYNTAYHFGDHIFQDLDITDDSACVLLTHELKAKNVISYKYKDDKGKMKHSHKWHPKKIDQKLKPTKDAKLRDQKLFKIPADTIDYGYYKLRTTIQDSNGAQKSIQQFIKILPPAYEDTVKAKIYQEHESLLFMPVKVNTNNKRTYRTIWRNNYYVKNELKDITITGPDALQFSVKKKQVTIDERRREDIMVEFHALQVKDMKKHNKVFLAKAELHAKDKDGNEYKVVLYGTNDY